MAWFKVDDQFAFNAKVMAAGNEAIGLWVRGSKVTGQITVTADFDTLSMSVRRAKEAGDFLAEQGFVIIRRPFSIGITC